MEKLQINELREHLINFFPLINPNTNTVNISENEDGSYNIDIGNGHLYTGFYPKSENNSIFTLLIVNGKKELSSGIDVDYIEGFIFFTKGFIPYKFVIHQYPQTQTIYLTEDGQFNKGEIIYQNNCPCGAESSKFTLEKPALVSESVDLAKLLA